MPDSNVYIGHVPFDSSYKHTIWFSSAQDQHDQMMQHMSIALSDVNYTHIREGAPIRVPHNTETLTGCNYLMYNNGGKWYYNFITGIEYINENTSALHLQRDVVQTWMFNWSRKPCFVEREHVADDTRFAHTVPEPSMPLEYMLYNYEEHVFEQDYVVVQTNAYPHYNTSETAVDGGDTAIGDVYDGVMSASKFIVYDMADEVQAARLRQDLYAMNAAGIADSVTNIFTVPADFIGGHTRNLTVNVSPSETREYTSVYEMANTARASHIGLHCNQSDSFGGYVPKNAKLYCYPFSYMEVGDFGGRKMELRFELFDSELPQGGVNLWCAVNGEMTGIIRPEAYEGIAEDGPATMTIDLSNKLPWTYSTYLNWSSQNGLSNALAIVGSVAGGTLSLIPSLAGAAGTLGQGLGGAIGQHALPNGAHYSPDALRRVNTGQALDALAEGGYGGVGAGIAGVAAVLANNDRMSRQPETARGNISGNSRLSAGMFGFYMANRALRRFLLHVRLRGRRGEGAGVHEPRLMELREDAQQRVGRRLQPRRHGAGERRL